MEFLGLGHDSLPVHWTVHFFTHICAATATNLHPYESNTALTAQLPDSMLTQYVSKGGVVIAEIDNIVLV